MKELIRKLKAKRKKMEEYEVQIKPLQVRYDKFKKEYDELRDELMTEMEKQGLEKATMLGLNLRVSSLTSPTLTNFEDFMDYVVKTKSFDLVHKRINNTAFKDHFLKDGKYTLPKWAGTFTRKDLKVTVPK